MSQQLRFRYGDRYRESYARWYEEPGDYGYAYGYDSTYDSTYDSGYEEDYAEDYEDEYEDNYEGDYEDDYEDEYEEQYEDNYDDEYEDEYEDGYDEDYREQYEQTAHAPGSLLPAALALPVSAPHVPAPQLGYSYADVPAQAGTVHHSQYGLTSVAAPAAHSYQLPPNYATIPQAHVSHQSHALRPQQIYALPQQKVPYRQFQTRPLQNDYDPARHACSSYVPASASATGSGFAPQVQSVRTPLTRNDGYQQQVGSLQPMRSENSRLGSVSQMLAQARQYQQQQQRPLMYRQSETPAERDISSPEAVPNPAQRTTSQTQLRVPGSRSYPHIKLKGRLATPRTLSHVTENSQFLF